MQLETLLSPDSWWFVWVILPLLIFIARILDQSIGTLRLIFISKGFKYLAPLVGFFESIIWLLAVSQIIQHLDNFACYIAYGGGFATGNYVGMLLEEKISIGKVLVRIVPKKDTSLLVDAMKEKRYGLTLMEATGSQGPVNVIISIINRKDLFDLVGLINHFNPNAFYTIEDVRSVKEGVFPITGPKKMWKAGMGPKKIK